MESSTTTQEAHAWTDRHVQLIESALRHADDVLAGAVDWDTVSKEAGYKNGTNAKVMYRRLLASVKGTKFGGATGSQRKAKIAKKPANQEIEDDSSVKNENEGENTESQPTPKKRKYTKKSKDGGEDPTKPLETPAPIEPGDTGVFAFSP